MNLPGVTCTHRWITDQCRATRGDEGAAAEAVEDASAAVRRALEGYPINSGAVIHVAVTVEPEARE